MTHEFLSEEWIDAALALGREYIDQVPTPEQSITMNQVITEAPFSVTSIEMHLDTSHGVPLIDRGHREDADVTITTDYVTAKTLFVNGDQTEAMQAFMTGKIMVEGDVAKLLAMQASAAVRTELQLEVAERLKEITRD